MKKKKNKIDKIVISNPIIELARTFAKESIVNGPGCYYVSSDNKLTIIHFHTGNPQKIRGCTDNPFGRSNIYNVMYINDDKMGPLGEEYRFYSVIWSEAIYQINKFLLKKTLKHLTNRSIYYHADKIAIKYLLKEKLSKKKFIIDFMTSISHSLTDDNMSRIKSALNIFNVEKTHYEPTRMETTPISKSEAKKIARSSTPKERKYYMDDVIVELLEKSTYNTRQKPDKLVHKLQKPPRSPRQQTNKLSQPMKVALAENLKHAIKISQKPKKRK